MTEPTEAEIDAAVKAYGDFLEQILSQNKVVTALGLRSAIRAALAAAAHARKAGLMPIYGATEGQDVVGYRPPDGE